MNIKKKIMATVERSGHCGVRRSDVPAVPQLTSAQTETPPRPANATTPQPAGDEGAPGDTVGHDKYLADALGITEADLQAAQTKAHEAAIKQAVTDGLITQAQADAMLNKTVGSAGCASTCGASSSTTRTLLADALGITVEKLQAAQETAAKAELAQAVTDGRITQAQADQITAERALQKYIADKGLFKSAVDSAVKDGVITQAQADTILAQAKPGAVRLRRHGPRRLRGGPGGHGGHGGRGGPDQARMAPHQPSTQRK